MALNTDRKRKADVLGRLETSSRLGRGSLSGWTTCPLCPPNRKKQYALGRGISAHLYAVHTPWKKKPKKKSSKRQRTSREEEPTATEESRDPTPQEEEEWEQRVVEITVKLEQDYQAKPGVDRAGKPSQSYRESLPPFLQAAADGNLQKLLSIIEDADKKEKLSQLLSTRDRNGSTPEHWAAGGGHLDCLKVLLEQRDKVPERPETFSEDATQAKPKKLRRRDGKTCLHYAARNGQVECMRYLVEERGHSVHVRSGDGTTPLHIACFGASQSAVQYLVDNGADIHAVNDWSCSAAHWTAMSQSQDCEDLVALCQVLHKAGISFVVAQKQGHSALHKAAQKQNQHVKELMAKSAEKGGPGLTDTERQEASKPDNGGHRPREIWSSAGGEATVAARIQYEFETS